jgi:hypothetical protein
MSTRLFDKGRQGFVDGSIDWDSNTIKAAQLQLDGVLTDTSIKAVTGATNASPIVLTITANGWANGDVIVVRGVGGNTSANGTWVVSAQATNTVTLTTVKDGLNSTGNGAYTSGGCAINLTQSDTYDKIDGALVGSLSSAFTTPTVVNGVLDADDVSYTGVTGTVHALAIIKDTGTAATSRPAVFVDGRMQVIVAADAATSATVVWVEQLAGPIPSGTVVIFSNGVSATLSSGAAAGARSLAVTALSAGITAGHTADVQTTNSGLPYTASGNNVTFQWDNGANKIIKV